MGFLTQRSFPDFRSLEVIDAVAPGDPMYAASPTVYFEAGPQALESIWLATLAAGLDEVRKVLDFGCGYGRVLRTLRVAFPEADLTACDLREDGLAFCAETFGATGVASEYEPERIALPGQFDLVWSGSHLSHIEKERWTGFVRLWESALAPDGVIVFTVYGRVLADLLRTGENMLDQTPQRAELMLRDYEENGFGFGEGLALGGGDTIVKPTWVCEQLEQTQLELLLYREHAWLGQDVVACKRRS